MCLIAVIPARKERQRVSNAWLEDVFRRNDDGFGFMWHDGRRVRAVRRLGKLEEWKAAFRDKERHVKGEFAFHLRMQTHGNTNLANAHPYPVDTETMRRARVFMMHNGILKTGNPDNPAMSDTWHFIKDYLRGMVTQFGEEILARPEFRRLVEQFIGSNRFTFIGPSGQLTIYNRQQGIDWRGMWLSNTYAWSAERFGAIERIKPTYRWDAGQWKTNAARASLATKARTWAQRSGWMGAKPKPNYSLPAGVREGLDPVDALDGVDVHDDLGYRDDAFYQRMFDGAAPPEIGTAPEMVGPDARALAAEFIDVLYETGHPDVADTLSLIEVAAYAEATGLEDFEEFTIEVSENGYSDTELALICNEIAQQGATQRQLALGLPAPEGDAGTEEAGETSIAYVEPSNARRAG